MTSTFLITGASGFVGSHVTKAARADPGVRLRLLTHRRPPAGAPGGATAEETIRRDLTTAGSLHGVCDGVDAVIHCATYIGGDDRTAESVNDHGTRALVAEAARCSVPVVQVSTAAVYGRGPFREAPPGTLPLAPISSTSRTRAAGERHVLEAGGVVLRPHLVYGTGDRWLVGGLVALLRQLSATVTGCDSLHSMIDADTLGRAALAAAHRARGLAGVHHLNHPEPVAGSDILAALGRYAGEAVASRAVDLATARGRVAGDPRALHHLQLLAVDHWFAEDGLWERLGCGPGAGFAACFPLHDGWYRGQSRTASWPSAPPPSPAAHAPWAPPPVSARRLVRTPP